MIFEQDSFVDGMNLTLPDVEVTSSGYCLCVNARTRFGYIDPITLPIEVVGAPAGLKQGLITVGNSVILFVAGFAYYKLYNSDNWIKVPGFAMNANVSNIYSIAVPASSLDYVRTLPTSGNIQDAIIRNFNSRVGGTPASIVCQDGVTQPQLITFNEITNIFAARNLNTYGLWTMSNPEYVPVGLFMFFLNNKLFIVSPDQSQIYQSTTGQPLNFAVNIKPDGTPGGDASTVSFAFDYDPITCVRPVNVANSFMYATKTTSRVITLDYTNTIFGEPQYQQAALIETGILNQYSLVEISGDYAFTNYEGLTSFNAVQQLKFEGRNSVFSKSIAKLFTNILQVNTVCFSFDNYAIFAVNTVAGAVFVVYDSLASKWIGCDNFNIGQVLQASRVDLPGEVRQYVITDQNKLFQLYSPDAPTATPAVLTRAYSTIGANNYYTGTGSYPNASPTITDIKSQKVDLVFRDGTVDGTVTCAELCEGVLKKTRTLSLIAAEPVSLNAIIPSFQSIIEPEGGRATFNFSDTPRGFKLSYLISWNTDAALMKLILTTTDYTATVSNQQRNLTLGKQLV